MAQANCWQLLAKGSGGNCRESSTPSPTRSRSRVGPSVNGSGSARAGSWGPWMFPPLSYALETEADRDDRRYRDPVRLGLEQLRFAQVQPPPSLKPGAFFFHPMPVKRIIPLPSFSTITKGNTAVCNIPVGPRYHVLQLSGDSGASQLATNQISEVRLKVNGKVQRQMTYAELDGLNTLNGAQFGIVDNASGGVFELPIFLAEPWRKSNATQDLLAWATGNVDSFQLEVDLSSPTNNLDALRAVAVIDNSIVSGQDGKDIQQPMGAIVKWFRTVIPAPATVVDINFGAINNRDNYQQISFSDASNYITSYKVIVDGFTVREVTKSENNAILKHYGMTPRTSYLDVVFDQDDIINNYLPMVGRNGERVQDFRIQLTCSTALTSTTAIAQVLGPAD